MFRKLLTTIVGVTATFAISITYVAPSQAKELAPNWGGQSEEAVVLEENLEATYPYISDQVLNLPAAEKTIEDSTFLYDFAEGYYYGGGDVAADPEVVSDIDANVQRYVTDEISPQGCAGTSGFEPVPPTVYLTSCQAANVMAVVAAGGSAATIAGVIAASSGIGAPAAAVIGAALAASGGLLGACTAPGTGIVVKVQNPVIPVPTCSAQ
ncbi:hypothetical protein [Propionimicrobium sp. PCR01-08-3]|uniref:hypothetical protein n=1 Tax=Propionimicrobium sp. PCR01-08-3 TaxID=3052086 RepID=UPI00255CB7A3|nr:hypothetical protein [Propionimicrobium sp. PCR01-08-3]WIY82000.1 hypothetical protein QQ658_10815 [Propionimicrobium sp. PCR01-08-3]